LTLIILGIASFGLYFLEFGFLVIPFGFSLSGAGVVYIISGRDITEEGFFVALLFGFIGAIIWVWWDMNQRGDALTSYRRSNKQIYYKQIAEKNYKCGQCLYFGKQGCPRNETNRDAEPCANFVT
jgi:hypothetical protein